MAKKNPRVENFKKKLRKETQKVWFKSVPIVVFLYVAMLLSFIVSGNTIVESGVRTATYFLMVIIGIIVGHKMALYHKLHPIPDDKKEKLKKKTKEVWLKSIPLVTVTYLVMTFVLAKLGNNILISSLKTSIFFIFLIAGILIGYKITSYQKLTVLVPEEKRELGINEYSKTNDNPSDDEELVESSSKELV